jgi:hypothetical protein
MTNSGGFDGMEKKKWETPKLIVLYKARPEENVLLVCKTAGAGAGQYAAACVSYIGTQCNAVQTS